MMDEIEKYSLSKKELSVELQGITFEQLSAVQCIVLYVQDGYVRILWDRMLKGSRKN